MWSRIEQQLPMAMLLELPFRAFEVQEVLINVTQWSTPHAR